MAVSAADIFFFILRWGVFLLSILAIGCAVWPVIFLTKYDRSKRGFREPPSTNECLAWAGVANFVYIFAFFTLGLIDFILYHEEVRVYRNIGYSVLLVPVIIGGLFFSSCLIFWTVTSAVTILKVYAEELSRLARKRYKFVGSDAQEQSELEETSRPNGGWKNDEEGNSGTEENAALMSRIDDDTRAIQEEA